MKWRIRRRYRDTRCVGKAKDGRECNNTGTKSGDGTYWCHIHIVQLLSQRIKQESGD